MLRVQDREHLGKRRTGWNGTEVKRLQWHVGALGERLVINRFGMFISLLLFSVNKQNRKSVET
ncbi:hypothetical protein [Bartonella tribocorum]|uniref:hypothetical protein n=1 Tax=Bartonella tribocorum TaxID=85701 RepID=UPI0002EE1F27|nr:hypothetical protein [Bartonella tribocorum]CDO49579.1 hypothetical protein BM1374166_01935 [Bartonella tribocorum]